MSNIYNQPHRGSITANGTATGTRINELLESISKEYTILSQEAVAIKQQKEEAENKVAMQLNEVNVFSQTLFEIENAFDKMKKQYEEEIYKLRRQLEQRDGAPPSSTMNKNQPQGNRSASYNPTNPPPISGSQSVPPNSYPVPSNTSQPVSKYMGNNSNEMNGNRARSPSTGPNKRSRVDGEPSPFGHGNSYNGPNSTNSKGPNPASVGETTDSSYKNGANNSSAPKPVTTNSAPPADSNNPPTPRTSTNSANNNPNANTSVSAPVNNNGNNTNSINDLDPEQVSASHKREGENWFAIFNPKIPRTLNVDLVHTFDHNSVVCCVRFSHDGKYLATGCNTSAQIYDVASHRQICTLIDDTEPDPDAYIRSVCFSPDNKLLAAGGEDQMIRVWDISSRRVIHLFQGHELDIYALEFSLDGKFLVSGSGDHTVRVWDIESAKCIHNFVIENPDNPEPGVTCVAISPNSKFIAAGCLDKIVRVWDAKTGTLLEKFEGHGDGVYSVAFFPDNLTLVSGSLDNSLKLWKLGPGAADGTPSSPSSQCLLSYAGHKDFVLSVGISPCGKWIMSGSKDRGVQFWDPKTAQTQFMLQGHKNSVISVAFSPTGQHFATGSGDMKAKLWSYKTIAPPTSNNASEGERKS